MLRKEVRKSSYYVWFLGVELVKRLQSSELEDALRKLLLRVSEDIPFDPVKVTLQVSHKGVKVLQSTTFRKSSKPDIKEFVPRDSIMFVQQDQDVVAFIVFTFDFETQWPLRMHAFRCDSMETAHNLTNQLHMLINQPEHQQKVADIETHLKSQCKIQTQEHPGDISLHSGTASSESSAASSSGDVASLYMSLAAELRQKLSLSSKEPLLLPPKDYDTMSRQRGNMAAVDLRREATGATKSRGNSGVNLAHAVSSSKSDNEWASNEDDDLVPLAATETKTTNVWRSSGETVQENPRRVNNGFVQASLETSKMTNIDHSRPNVKRQRSPSPSRLAASYISSDSGEHTSPHDRFKDAKEKFQLLERECFSEQDKEFGCKIIRPSETPIQHNVGKDSYPYNEYVAIQKKLAKYLNHDVLEEKLKQSCGTKSDISSRFDTGNKTTDEDECACCQNICRLRASPHTDEGISTHYGPVYSDRSDILKRNVDRKKNSDYKYESQPNFLKHSFKMKYSDAHPRQFSDSEDLISDSQSSQIFYNLQSEHDNEKLLPINSKHAGNIRSQKLKSDRVLDYRYLDDESLCNKYHKPQYKDNRNVELICNRHSPFDVIEQERHRHLNEFPKEFKQMSCTNSCCLEPSLGEKHQLVRQSQVDRKRNYSYQELSDHERFPGLDRETARLQHHNNIANANSLDLNAAPTRHSYAELGVHKSDENVLSLPYHQPLRHASSNAGSGRIGIAVVHKF